MLCENAMNQTFETQTFRYYGLNFICLLNEICTVTNAAHQNLIQASKFKSI